jgi:hypothetical protein
MTHLVNRLQFELRCLGEDQAFQLRQHFAQNFQDDIANVVDTICSKYVTGDEWIRIDKLEIDLGRFSPTSLDANFLDTFLYQFEKAFSKKLNEISPLQKAASRDVSYLELLQYFLQMGILPWWAEETDIDIQEITKYTLSNEASASALIKFLRIRQFKAPTWQRLAWQFNSDAREQVIQLFSELDGAYKTLTDWIKAIVSKIFETTPGETGIDMPELQKIIQRIVLENAPIFFQYPDDTTTAKKVLEGNMDKLFPESSKDATTILTSLTTTIASNVLLPQDIVSPAAGNKSNFLQAEEIIEKLSVRQAGLVLLAPFLNPFFTELALLEGKKFKDDDARYRAIHLLKYLSTGQENLPEFSLSLEKLLCNTPIEEPVPLDIKLQDKEIKEAGQLLGSILEHWKALKNTSVNGLRETFLKRDGLVTRKEKDWLLQVERKTWDVLLDSVPWGYSTIILPWNDYLVYVEW